MTLHEFAERNGGIRSVLDDMEHRIRTRDKVAGPEEWRKNLDIYYNDYYMVLGYLRAAYNYGKVSFEEELALEEELILMLTEKKGHR